MHYTTILGPARAERISPAASAQQRGIRFTIHNDASVTPTRPLHLAHCAVERRTYGGRISGGAQKISRLSALRTMTIDSTWQVFEDSKRGSIENGKLADLVILSENPLETSKSLNDIRVMQSIRLCNQSAVAQLPIRRGAGLRAAPISRAGFAAS